MLKSLKMDYYYFGILNAITNLKLLRGGQLFYYSVSKASQSTCKAEICFHVYEKITIFSLYFKSHVKLSYILRIVTCALVVWFVIHWGAVIKEWRGRKQQFNQVRCYALVCWLRGNLFDLLQAEHRRNMTILKMFNNKLLLANFRIWRYNTVLGKF